MTTSVIWLYILSLLCSMLITISSTVLFYWNRYEPYYYQCRLTFTLSFHLSTRKSHLHFPYRIVQFVYFTSNMNLNPATSRLRFHTRKFVFLLYIVKKPYRYKQFIVPFLSTLLFFYLLSTQLPLTNPSLSFCIFWPSTTYLKFPLEQYLLLLLTISCMKTISFYYSFYIFFVSLGTLKSDNLRLTNSDLLRMLRIFKFSLQI